jgi:hypothetical protein
MVLYNFVNGKAAHQMRRKIEYAYHEHIAAPRLRQDPHRPESATSLEANTVVVEGADAKLQRRLPVPDRFMTKGSYESTCAASGMREREVPEAMGRPDEETRSL